MARGRWHDNCHELGFAPNWLRTLFRRRISLLQPLPRLYSAVSRLLSSKFLPDNLSQALLVHIKGHPFNPDRAGLRVARVALDSTEQSAIGRRSPSVPPSARIYPGATNCLKLRPTHLRTRPARCRCVLPFLDRQTTRRRQDVFLEPRPGSVAPRLQRPAETRRCLGIHRRRPRIPHLHGQVVHQHRRHEREHLRGHWESAPRRLLPPARAVVAGRAPTHKGAHALAAVPARPSSHDPANQRLVDAHLPPLHLGQR